MALAPAPIETPITRLAASAYTVPTETPESDGTFEWYETTIVVVEVEAGGAKGLGFSYTSHAAVHVIEQQLVPCVVGLEAMDTPAAWGAMVAAVRNLGLPGIAATAISAVDIALWDLKARLLDVPLVTLLGAARKSVAIYASGGFTSFDVDELQQHLASWVADGMNQVKIKVGRSPTDDRERVRAARAAIGADGALFVDANGAYATKQALGLAEEFAGYGVTWFEEPVSSDDLEGLRLLRERVPAEMEIAAGEYGYDRAYFRRMLEAGAVDVLQADATRCLGITGFLVASALADAFAVPLSAHTAPALHLHPCCAVRNVRHIEWFHDHVRIERLLFDGVVEPEHGMLSPDLSRPGHGLELKQADAERYASTSPAASSA